MDNNESFCVTCKVENGLFVICFFSNCVWGQPFLFALLFLVISRSVGNVSLIGRERSPELLLMPRERKRIYDLSWRARDPTFSLFWPAGFQQDDHYYTIKCGCSGGWGGRKKWSREPEELLFLSPPEFLFIHGSHQAD